MHRCRWWPSGAAMRELTVPRSPGRAATRRFCRTALSESLPTHDSGSLANDDELVGFDAGDLLGHAVGPADCQLRGRCRAETEMQAAIVRGVEARLRGHFLCLGAVAVTGGHARADGAAIRRDAGEQ